MGALSLIMVAVWLLLRRRKQKGLTTSPDTPLSVKMQGPDNDFAAARRFINGQWKSEVHAQHCVDELNSEGVHVVPEPPAELDGAAPAE